MSPDHGRLPQDRPILRIAHPTVTVASTASHTPHLGTQMCTPNLVFKGTIVARCINARLDQSPCARWDRQPSLYTTTAAAAAQSPPNPAGSATEETDAVHICEHNTLYMLAITRCTPEHHWQLAMSDPQQTNFNSRLCLLLALAVWHTAACCSGCQPLYCH